MLLNYHTYTASRIFTGEHWLERHVVIVQNGRIKSVEPLTGSSSRRVTQFDDCAIVPAFIDIQVYGANGKLLAAYPDPSSLIELRDHAAKSGTALSLPTVATNTNEVFFACIDAVRSYWKNGGEGIAGLHIEGPWINPLKRGAHVESLVCNPKPEEVKQLLDYGKGVIKMITLAPEVCSEEIILMIRSYGIIISAGHSNATYEEAKQAFKFGINVATHLYNAMSPLLHREPGLVGAVMDSERVMASIIPDGHHVDFAALRIAKHAMGKRLFAITDAVTDTEKGYYHHKLAGDKYEADGILSGSALTMNSALKNLVNYAHISLDEALRMCSLYPARVLKIENAYGMIAQGYICRMAVLNAGMDVIQLI